MTSKLVLITGASSGIGEAAAKRYGAAGAHVLLLARNAERLFSVAHAIREAGGTATALPIDLVDLEATKEVTTRIEGEIGTPDVLVNNAGAGRWLPLIDTSPEEARTMIDVPYLAAFNLTRAFTPAMIARARGSLVFITSPASYLAWPNASAYIAARRALAGFAEALQSELKGTGVSVTLVVLGTVETPYWGNNPGSRENLPATDPRLIPTLTPEQAAQAIFAGAEAKRPFVVKPAIYRALFVMNALFPKTVASQLRRAAKKARAKNR
ncbi:MAG TPA: SDR family NAD(P)-dependent oxidoreductase [Methyloceanibacter sp.]|nr:SDR family NAD(P)-dependent oxidoreductase [Methyloceanibacter sp.]